MGEGELFLAGLTREQALELAARARGTESRPEVPAPAMGPVGTGPRSERSRSPASPSPAPAAAPLRVLPATYEELRDEALACTRCRLAETRTQVVFSDGAVDARLVVVGEAPGANEDATGLPFVGAAGKYLDLLLAAVDLTREETVYICNVLKCRPPGNRDPMPDEIEACSPFLKKQLELIRPQALLAVGSFSARLLTGQDKSALGKLRGTVHAYEGVPLVCTYHPAALLRNPNWTRAFWDDLQLLRTVLDRE
jgi:DNA polymerase